MNDKIQKLLARLEALEDELIGELREQKHNLQFRIEGSRVRFDSAVDEANRKLRTRLRPWFLAASWRNTVSAPVIYSLIIPLSFLDLCVTVYQSICFRLYRIPRVKRSQYMHFDRRYLSYLNGIEKFNCLYCSYGNGVIAYVREVVSRTEQYWCPIKHAQLAPGVHRRYSRFIDYGDGEDYQERLLKFREELKAAD